MAGRVPNKNRYTVSEGTYQVYEDSLYELYNLCNKVNSKINKIIKYLEFSKGWIDKCQSEASFGVGRKWEDDKDFTFVFTK